MLKQLSNCAFGPKLDIINVFQYGCLVAQVYDQFRKIMHVVLYDEDETNSKNDGNYYFKNSHPAEPFIVVPKNRVTYKMYQALQNHIHMISQVNGQFYRTLQTFPDFEMNLTGTYWTIYDDFYAISIKKK